MFRRAGALSLLLATACPGSVGGPGPDAPPADHDAGPGASIRDGGVGATADGGPVADCDEVTPVATLFATTCANNGACHVPGAQYPALIGDLAALVGAPSAARPAEKLITPNDPNASWLFRKMSGTQGAGGGLLMPVGSAEPIDGVSIVEAWIDAGAPTECPEPIDVTPPADPNTLDQAELFTCTGTSASSPARLRRVERTEWTHSAGHRVGSLAHDNPFFAPEGRYSTNGEGVSIEPATLDLYMLVLPQAASLWSRADPGPQHRKVGIYGDRDLRCIFNDVAPDDACIDHYVDELLSKGVLFRAPTDDERTRLRALLVATLAAEGGDVAQRRTTLEHVASAAWLTSGALFRAEGSEAIAGDASRTRLSDDELALALGGVLSTHPPGSPLPQRGVYQPGDPDRSNPALGWLGQIRAAADDGSIQSPSKMRQLLAMYRAGVDVDRADLAFEIDSREVPARGEYWLADRLRGFFREYLDYDEANTAFKDNPSATSAWEGEWTANLSYSNLQHSYYGHESTLMTQLDDTIARVVIDAEQAGEDVFAALLTDRKWRLPSNLMASSGVACTSDADCAGQSGNTRCQAGNGSCSGSTSNHHASVHRVYGLDDNVPNTQDGRWVDMPATARAGVLTHPAWLTAHGGNFEDDASAVMRGKWIREHLYCQTVPGLDLVRVEAQLVPSAPELRARDRIRVSIEEGPQADTCMGCHRLMNSLGMPFEVYNHAGFPRASDHGQPPDGTSSIVDAPDPSLAGDVQDAVELSQMLADSPYARRCFVRHVFRYFMGRDETMADACTLASMESAFAGGSFFAMLDALVTSDGFRFRHVEEAQ